MRVALVFYSNTDFGGAERRLIRVYNKIGKTFNCDLLVRGCTEDTLLERIKKSDSRCDEFNDVICFESNLKCIKHLIRKHYNVVHCFDTSGFNAFIVSLLPLLGCKTIVTLASVTIAERLRDGIPNIKDKLIIHLATVVDILYPWCYKHISRFRLKKITRITVGTFTDLNVFKPAKKDKILVYAAARLENIKNPSLLIEACEKIKKTLRNYGYKVLLLGKGELESELKDSIKKYGIQDIVKMIGYKKTSEYFPIAEAVFSLQRNENYPSQVIAEACACGCYLFITDVGNSRICATEDFCTFVDANPESLGKAIENFILLPKDEKEMAILNAREYANNNYTINNSFEYYLELIKGVSNNDL